MPQSVQPSPAHRRVLATVPPPLTNRHPPRNPPHSRHCKTRSTEHIQRVSIGLFVNISIIFANLHTRSRLFGVRTRFNKTTATGDCSSSPKLNCFCPPPAAETSRRQAAGACMYMPVCTVRRCHESVHMRFSRCRCATLGCFTATSFSTSTLTPRSTHPSSARLSTYRIITTLSITILA